MFNAVSTGAFNAYHNNTLRFSTTSAGAQVTGELVVTGNMTSQANVNGNGQNLTNLNASNASSGTLPMARLSGTLPALNGSALTNLNGSNISSGTIPSARVSGIARAVTSTTIRDLVAPAGSATGTAPDLRFGSSQTGASVTVDVTNIDYVTISYGMEAWIATAPTAQNYCTSFTSAQIRVLRSGSGSAYQPTEGSWNLNMNFFTQRPHINVFIGNR
jgi:hypothetical protein